MKNKKVCNKARSPPASLQFKGQGTEHTTVKWPVRHCEFVSQGACIFLKKQKTQNDRFFSNWKKKKTDEEKKLSLNRVFDKLDYNK